MRDESGSSEPKGLAPSSWRTRQRAPSVPVPDTGYAASANFYNVADQARDDGDLAATIWSSAVSDFELTLDAAVATEARLVAWEFTLTNELLTESMTGNVTLRSPKAPE